MKTETRRGKFNVYYLYKGNSIFTITAKNLKDALFECRCECPKDKYKIERKGKDFYAITK